MTPLPRIGAGQLDTLAELQKKVEIVTAAGGRQVTWQRERDVWCNVRGLSPRLRIEARAREPQLTHEVIARQEDDIDATKRLVVGNTDYFALTQAHYNCEGTGDLIAAVGTPNITEQTAIGEVADGIIGKARGTFAQTSHFSSDIPGAGGSGTSAFDVEQQSVDKFTFMMWARLPSLGSPKDFCIAEVGDVVSTSWAWSLRSVFNLTNGNVLGSGVLLRDIDGAAWGSFGVGPEFLPASYPVGEWNFHGFAVNVPQKRLRLWWYTQSFGQHFREVLLTFEPFKHSGPSEIAIGDNPGKSAVHNGSAPGDYDHISALKGIEFDEEDVAHFWKGGLARTYPDEFKGTGARRFMIAGVPEDVDEGDRLVRFLAAEGVAT